MSGDRSPALSRGAVAALLAGSGSVAALSLLLPWAPSFDAWSWLVWAREVGELDLDTTAGPSWKPLPVLLMAPFAPVGDLGAELWMLLTRTSWLVAAGLAGCLAAALAPARAADAVPGGRVAVAGIAALGLLLLDDSFTPWLRQGATGLSEPLLAALALGAFGARLGGRDRLALALLWGCALLRPEAWLILGLLVAERWREGDPGARAALVAIAASVPLLWFAPDMLGSGDPLTGAGRARESGGAPPFEALESLGRLALLPLAVLWLGAAVAIRELWAGSRPVRELTTVAALWAGQVAVLSAVGYAGLPRFMTPAAAAACVLGAAGLAVGWERLRAEGGDRSGPGTRGRRAAAIAAAAVVALGGAGWRAADLVGDVGGITERADAEERMTALATRPSLEAGRCGPVYVGEYLFAPALAWELELPLASVRPVPRRKVVEEGVLIHSLANPPPEGVAAGGRPIAHAGGLVALGFGCPP